MARAIIIEMADVLTDESGNDREAIALLRQIVATAGVRVVENALAEAEKFAIESFAPHTFHAMIFKLVNRDTSLALRCISAFKKNFKPKVVLRKEAGDLLQLCKQRGWQVALSHHLSEIELAELERAKLLDMIDIKGLPKAMKLSMPDPRVLEFMVGALGVSPGDCIMLGTRIDNNVRPGNLLRMTTVHLQAGWHGKGQFARDLKDVPDYEAPNIDALLSVLSTVV